jgi:two-component system, sensor histidine kinase
MTPSVNAALILNVDDTEAARYAKTRILTRAGFIVIEASTGSEALLRAHQDRPDLVLLDIKLPDINGFEVCRRIKENTATQAILVLQTSASYIASADKIRALEGGADNYLFEPIEPEELVANVRALLRLSHAERELREVDRRKDVFLATLAHELRNPLAPILTAVELLRLLDPDVPPSQERARRTILRQTNYMIRLVDDLLDVSRITNGKIVLKKERVQLHGFVNAAAETVASIMDQRNHALSVEWPAEDVWVVGDSVRLAQIVANLLNNAAKFTPLGGEIALTAEQDGKHVRIRVRDNGIGLSPENAASIFDLFVQAGHAPDRAQDGLGIGLSLVRGLVELHGGTVKATSPGEGLGSTFEVSLPLAAPGQPASDDSVPMGDMPTAHRRILVVDDNVDGAEMIRSLLEMQGHILETAHTGVDAIARMRTFHPEVVILDIGLPDISGLELARRLRAMEGMEAVRLIALSGYGKKEDKDAARLAGFDFHLTKPVSNDALASAIASLKLAST